MEHPGVPPLRQRLGAFFKDAWPRWDYLVGGGIPVVLAVAWWIVAKVHGGDMSADIPAYIAAVLLVLAIFGASFLAWQRRYLENLRLQELLRAKLDLSYQPKDPWIKKLPRSNIPDIQTKQIISAPSFWFRVQLKNCGQNIAHGCRVSLVDIEYLDGANFIATGFGNSQPLRWSEDGGPAQYQPQDVSTSDRRFIDVISVDPVHNVIHVKWPQQWIANEDLFSKHGQYRLTICASSEDAGNAQRRLLLKWNGVWDETEISVDLTDVTR